MSGVLFCPFCREAFEAETVCPDHDLPLVDFRELPRTAPSITEDTLLSRWSPAGGRGLLAAGALGALLAFMTLPFASSEGAVQMGGSMLKLALLGSHKLWLIAAAASAQLALLARRRTLRSLRGARVAAFIIGIVPLVALLWSYRATEQATARFAAREGMELVLRLASGGYALIACSTLMCIAALRLGLVLKRRL